MCAWHQALSFLFGVKGEVLGRILKFFFYLSLLSIPLPFSSFLLSRPSTCTIHRMSGVGQWVLLVAKGDILCTVYEKVRRSYIFWKKTIIHVHLGHGFFRLSTTKSFNTLSASPVTLFFFQCFFFFLIFVWLFFFNWRKITLKCCVVSAVQQCHNYTL